MAVLALGAVFAGLGAASAGALGISALTAASIGWTVGSTLGLMLFGPMGGTKTSGPRLQDLKVQASTYGQMIPFFYGTDVIAANLIWSTDVQEHKKEVDAGSTLFGGTESTLYWYDVSMAIAICEGPIEGYLRLWADTKLVFDSRKNAKKRFKYKTPITFYLGTADQMPDPTIEAKIGEGMVPAHRYLAYIVLKDFPLADFGNRVPNFTAEVTRVHSEDNKTGPWVTTGFEPNLLGRNRLLKDKRPGMNFVYIQQEGAGGGEPAYYYKFNAATCQVDGAFQSLNTWNTHGSMDINEDGVLLTSTDSGELSLTYTYQNVSTIQAETGQPLSVGIAPPGITGLVRDEAAIYYTVSGAQRVGNWGGAWVTTQSDLHHSNVYSVDPATGNYLGHWDRTFFGALPGFAAGPTGVRDIDGDIHGVGWAVVSNTTETRLVELGGADRVWDITSTGIYFGEIVVWLPGENNLLVFGSGTPPFPQHNVYKINPETGELISSMRVEGPHQNTVHNGFHDGLRQWHPSWNTDHSLETVTGSYGYPVWVEYDFATMEKVQERHFTDALLQPFPPQSGVAGGPASSAYFPELNTIVSVEIGRAAILCFHLGDLGGCESLKVVMDDIANKTGLLVADTDTDFSDLAGDRVCGYSIGRPSPLRNIADPLAIAYAFGVVESNGKVKSVKRGGGFSGNNIPEDDLMTHERGQARPDEPVVENILQSSALPRQIDVIFKNPLLQYEQDTEYYRRHSRVANDVTEDIIRVELPMVFQKEEAKNIAGRVLNEAWIERVPFEFTLPISYLKIDPLDLYTITFSDGRVQGVRILDVNLGANWVLEVKAVRYDQSLYTPSVVAPPEDITFRPGDTIPDATQASLMLFDVPIFREEDNNAGIYAAATPEGGMAADGYRGASLFYSLEGNAWVDIATIPASAISGFTTTKLEGYDRWTVWDDTNTVTVRMEYGELHNATDAQVLNWINTMIIGTEIIRFGNASPIEGKPGHYILSHLLRAVKGTDYALDTHEIGDRVILVDPNSMIRTIPPPNGSINSDRYYKAISIGEDFDDGLETTFRNTARGLRPYSLAHIKGEWDNPTSGDITITWFRRTRLDGSWLDGGSVPLGEEAEKYEFDVMDTDGETVIRTFSGITGIRSQVYTAAQQTTDFGGPVLEVNVVGYQISGRVGRGFPSVRLIKKGGV